MFFATDIATVSHGIQLAVAPVFLLTAVAGMIGLTIKALFLGQTTEFQILRTATILFLSGISFFLLALLCFLAETLIATRVLKFGHLLHAGTT